MTKAEQKRFVRDLARSVTDGILAKADKWPAEWDGHELRALLAVAFVRESTLVYGKIANDRCDRFTDQRRRRAFGSVCAKENLP